MPARSLVLALAAATALGGCTLAPRYERPGLPVGQAWPVAAEPPSSPLSGADLAWRDVFRDARLQSVIALALEQNRDMRVAVANIARARATYRIQRADLLPTINATGSYTRSEVACRGRHSGPDWRFPNRAVRGERRLLGLRTGSVRPGAEPQRGGVAVVLRHRGEPAHGPDQPDRRDRRRLPDPRRRPGPVEPHPGHPGQPRGRPRPGPQAVRGGRHLRARPRARPRP